MLFTKYFHIKLIAVLLTCSSIVVFGQSVSEMKRAQMTKQKSKQVNKPAMRTEEAIFDAMRACMERCDQLSREECMNQCWDATSGVSANVVTRGDSQERAEGNETRCVQGQGEGDRCETQIRRSPSSQEGSTNASNERRGEERGEDRNSRDDLNRAVEAAAARAMRECVHSCDLPSREECMNRCREAARRAGANLAVREDGTRERDRGNERRCVQGQGEGDRCETQLRRSPSNQEGSTNASNERRGEERGEDRNSVNAVNGMTEATETRSGQTPSNTVSINNNSERNDSEKSKSKDSEDPSKGLEN